MAKVPDNFYNNQISGERNMSSGRFMTDYHSNCELNLRLPRNLSSWQYRLFLTRNASNLMNMTNEFNDKRYGCVNCDDPSIPAQNRFLQECTNFSCNVKEMNKGGIGLY